MVDLYIACADSTTAILYTIRRESVGNTIDLTQFAAQAGDPNTAKDRRTARPSPSTFVIFSRIAAALDTGAGSSVVWLEHSFITRFRPIAVPLKVATWRTTGSQGASPLPCGPPPPPPQTPTVAQGNSHGCGALQSRPVVYTTQHNFVKFV